MRNVLSAVLVVIGATTLVMHAVSSGVAQASSLRPVSSAQAGSLRYTGGAIVIPVAGVRATQLKSTFNEGRVGHLHHAIDILAKRGTPVLAAVDGRVRKLFRSRAGGITIYEWDAAGTTSYYYAHLDRYADGLAEGKALRQGEVIGYVGTTGNAPPGTPHLHFAIEKLPPTKEWWKGDPVDPYPILVARGVTQELTPAPLARSAR